jgi:hypothetical protein
MAASEIRAVSSTTLIWLSGMTHLTGLLITRATVPVGMLVASLSNLRLCIRAGRGDGREAIVEVVELDIIDDSCPVEPVTNHPLDRNSGGMSEEKQ